jgi:hypothetical protein
MAMLRFYLRLIFLPLVLFTTMLLLIHVQPYDDHDLRQLLLPDGCPAPCFMGIRPDVTTAEEALQILNTSNLIKDVQSYGTLISWSWGNLRSTWIDSRGGKIIIDSDSQLVDAIVLYTNVSIGEVRLALGSPNIELVSMPQANSNSFWGYVGIYFQYGVGIQAEISCMNTEPFRNPPVIIISEPEGDTTSQLNYVNAVFRLC